MPLVALTLGLSLLGCENLNFLLSNVYATIKLLLNRDCRRCVLHKAAAKFELALYLYLKDAHPC